MKKVLFIPVGGTICTAPNEHGALDVTEAAGLRIIENFKKSTSAFADKTEFEVAPNLGFLSENMTVEKWNVMLKTYRKYSNNFDGVIFAHGTDTLAYSAAVFSMLFNGTQKPVFFVSSNAPLHSKRANGNENFRVAVECIGYGITPNVYVPYKNISDGRLLVHLASRLKQCENYSEDFESVGAVDLTEMTAENHRIFLQAFEKFAVKKISVDYSKISLKNNVLVVMPYPGLNYDTIDYSRYKAVLHGTYHSGTVCTENCENSGSVLKLLDICRGKTAVYLSPSRFKGEIYDTLRVAASHNDGQLNTIYGCTTEAAYAKLVIAYSLFSDDMLARDFVRTEQNFEFFEKE